MFECSWASTWQHKICPFSLPVFLTFAECGVCSCRAYDDDGKHCGRGMCDRRFRLATYGPDGPAAFCHHFLVAARTRTLAAVVNHAADICIWTSCNAAIWSRTAALSWLCSAQHCHNHKQWCVNRAIHCDHFIFLVIKPREMITT